MPLLCEFNTYDFHPASDPRPDNGAILRFPRSLVARPRVAHGFRKLEVDASAPPRAKSTIPYFNTTFADCHISTWYNTILRGGIASILVLTPADLDFLTGEHMHKSGDPASVRVDFERRFVTPPKVVVFFNEIDLGQEAYWRINVSASDIDVHGFTLHIDTWADTVLFGVNAGWIAYPEDREYIFSTSVSTMDMRSPMQPQTKQSIDVVFGLDKFWKEPSVFVALNSIHISCHAPLRIDTYVDSVTKTGLVCHIDTWMDTLLLSAGVSIIAFN